MIDEKQENPQHEDQHPEQKKGMPDMKKEDEKDPHRGITRTPSQHDSLAPEDEALEENDFQDEIELEDED